MRHRIALAAVSALILSGCGHAALRTAVVAPSASVALLQGPGNYVYVGRRVSTTGTVMRVRGADRDSHYVLANGAGYGVALPPASMAAGDAGRRVSVTGIFDVRFEYGPQLTIQQVQV